MNRNRRAALRSLAAASLLGSMPTLATPIGTAPINLVGFGSCGGRIVRRLAEERCGVSDSDFLAAEDPKPDRGVPPVEVLGNTGAHHQGRPLVVLTGVSSRSRGERAWQRAIEWSETQRSIVVPVVVLGFEFEGSYRDHGIALAGRFAERFGTVSLIDNQAIDERWLSPIDNMSLLDLWDRINDQAMPRIERVIAASRNA